MKTNNIRGGERKTLSEREIDRSHTTDTSEEDDSHAVITVHPNKVRKREKKERERERRRDRMIERRKKSALSSENWTFSPLSASVQNFKDSLKLNRVLMKVQKV